MSIWARQKKIYVSLLLIIFILSVISISLFFSFSKPISCFDGKQNGLEEGVDCGGTCSLKCNEEPKRIIPLWTRPFKLSDGVFSAVSYVENQNRDLSSENKVEIVLYDKNGDQITRATKNVLILENGITPIFIPHIITQNRVPTRATTRFIQDFVFTDEFVRPDITFSDIEINESPAISVRATATNNSNYSIREIDFVAILYNEKDVAVSASKTFKRNFKAGEIIDLNFTWVLPFDLIDVSGGSGEIKKVEITPVLNN